MHRRRFLATTAAVVAGFPAILGADDKAGTRKPILGAGDYQFECDHHWAQLPREFQWQTTHGICFDADGMAYVIMQGREKTPAVDTIHVFDPEGKHVRSLGPGFHPGGHGIDWRREGSESFLYICDVAHLQVVKIDLRGEVVWKLNAPREAGVYHDKAKFKPTNVAFLPDGGFVVGDGYGSNYLHLYTADAKYVRTFGGPKELKTPHGQGLDTRGAAAKLLVADRGNDRLVGYTLNGERTEQIVPGLLGPCNVDFHGDLAIVPELWGRLTLLGRENQPLVRLGEDPAWTAEMRKTKVRNDPRLWPAGKFIHPHDATFDASGNIYVAEWVATGRLTKLRRV